MCFPLAQLLICFFITDFFSFLVFHFLNNNSTTTNLISEMWNQKEAKSFFLQITEGNHSWKNSTSSLYWNYNFKMPFYSRQDVIWCYFYVTLDVIFEILFPQNFKEILLKECTIKHFSEIRKRAANRTRT